MNKKTTPSYAKATAGKQKTGELIYGIHPIVELLKAKHRKLISIYTTKPHPKAWKEIEDLLPARPVPIQYVSRDVLANIAGTTDHQGVLAWAQPFPIRKKMFEPSKTPFVLMLDGIQDTRNLGAIIRSAYCTGVQGIILTRKNTAPLNASAIKASAGLAEHVEVYIANSAIEAAQHLKAAGYELYLATFDGENAATCTYKKPACLVIGGEGFGISKEIMRSGTHITIPQRTKDISYNASVAAGILLFIMSSHIGALKK
jgi:23S rRNA (guanosine2251-2'-O)-methyltransferase